MKNIAPLLSKNYFLVIHKSFEICIEEITLAPIQAQFSGLLGVCNLTLIFLGANFLILYVIFL